MPLVFAQAGTSTSTSIRGTLQGIVDREGMRGLYRGIQAQIVSAFLVGAILLTVREEGLKKQPLRDSRLTACSLWAAGEGEDLRGGVRGCALAAVAAACGKNGAEARSSPADSSWTSLRRPQQTGQQLLMLLRRAAGV